MQKDSPLKVIIIDDDEFNCAQLEDVIRLKFPGISILAICNEAVEGLEKIRKLKPDLLFLDIEMPGMNGFELLRKLPAINFEIIFTTAYDHYAIKAIRFSAIDYLLKPISFTALQDALERLDEKRKKYINTNSQQLELLPYPTGKVVDNLAVPTLEGFLFVSLQDIVWCSSDDKYTELHLTDKKVVVSSRTLGDFEDVLHDQGFFRIHKSYLINLKHLRKYLRGIGGQVVMSDGESLDVSRRKKDELIQRVATF